MLENSDIHNGIGRQRKVLVRMTDRQTDRQNKRWQVKKKKTEEKLDRKKISLIDR